jgi:hypothetical protein
MEPTSYPRAPISKKRIWFDARTLYPMTMISYDRQGKIWKQWEGGSDYYEQPRHEVVRRNPRSFCQLVTRSCA